MTTVRVMKITPSWLAVVSPLLGLLSRRERSDRPVMLPQSLRGLSTPVRQGVAALVLLGALTWAAHGGALPGAFHYDDFYTFVQNPIIKSWHPFRYFTSTNVVSNTVNAASYRPLTLWSFAATYQFAGMRPMAFLALNVLLHLAASWLVFLVGRQVFPDARWAWVAGGIYAIHPVNAEAVNYAVARYSLLSTVFVLGSAYACIRYVKRGGGAGVLVAGMTAFLCALLSKESAVGLAVPLLAYAWLRPSALDPAETARVHRAAFAYAGLAALYVAFWRLITAGGVTSLGPSAQPGWTFLEMVGRSLALWVWPWPLGLDHPLTFLSRFDPWLAGWLLLGAIGLMVAFWWGTLRSPVVAWGLVWAIAGFAPLIPLPWLTTVGLLQEQRMGFSAAGLSWATAALASQLWTAAGRRGAATGLRWIIVCAGALWAIVSVGMDRERAAVWNDDRRLWAEVVRRSPDNLQARINSGAAYMMRREYERADAEFREILALAPTYYRAHYNLGLSALRQDRTDEATAEFRRAIALNPRDADSHTNLGILMLRAGETRAAESAFRIALEIDPTERDALNNLATIYLQRREWAKALSLVTEALRRDPDFVEASYNRGVALVGLGRRMEAANVFREMRDRLSPDSSFDRYRDAIDHTLAAAVP